MKNNKNILKHLLNVLNKKDLLIGFKDKGLAFLKEYFYNIDINEYIINHISFICFIY